jgi:hypothetical protein
MYYRQTQGKPAIQHERKLGMQESTQPPQPSHDQIAVLAHQIWEQSGRPDGQDVEIWLQAEQSLLSTVKPQPPAACQVERVVPPPQSKPSPAKVPGPRTRKSASKPGKGGPGPF